MRYRELNAEELKAFFAQELASQDDLTDNELSLLKVPVTRFPEKAFILTCIIGIFDTDETLVGFCLVPSYSKTIASSLYIGRQYRNRGFASWILNELKIDTLNCLVDNLNAIRLYESLDFKSISKTSFSIRFERKLS